MTNRINNSVKSTERVWVPAHDNGKAPLISIWIDPTMTAFDASQKSGELAGITEATTSEEIEDHLQSIGGWPSRFAHSTC
jgi:hypothetical protein